MYESYYGLTDKPFRLRPDPAFFFGSKGHKRAMGYLEYGLSQGEGFIVITGEIGAGKTTLVRNLLKNLESTKIVAAHIVNTHLDPDNILKMVAGAFAIPGEDASKATLLIRIEKFLRQADHKGKRVLLVVDEAQNLAPQTVEELRMLSNFQANDKSLLQTFLLGQPEFRKTLRSDSMQQLRQRVIATYHLGPMNVDETRAYIEHRLHMVGWRNNPSFSPEAFYAIYSFSGGIPRKINTLCDRLFLMGFLEEIHAFGVEDVEEVIRDIQEETKQPVEDIKTEALMELASIENEHSADALKDVYDRIYKLEKTMTSVLNVLKRIVSHPSVKNLPIESNQ
jgi:putative secretion ATPase (PEP-CTERM system associated)